MMARRSPRTGNQPVSISFHSTPLCIMLDNTDAYTSRHRFSTAASQSLAVSPAPRLLLSPGKYPLISAKQADLDAQERVAIFLHRWDYICANWWSLDMGQFTGTCRILRHHLNG